MHLMRTDLQQQVCLHAPLLPVTIPQTIVESRSENAFNAIEKIGRAQRQATTPLQKKQDGAVKMLCRRRRDRSTPPALERPQDAAAM
jgi:hypothetical protein